VPRNQEVIRQWKVLHALESSRHGTTIPALADDLRVTTRTIRRDLAALQEAGFPLFDERDDEGHVRWRLDGQVLKGLETGFTLPELCSLYLSRNLLEAVGATPFQRDLTLAFRRLEKLLTPRMRQFLDRLPGVLVAKRGPRSAASASSSNDVVGKLLEATLHNRVASMTYHSVSSAAVRDYLIHPYRLAFAQGGLYLLAFVPAYKDIRTFAVDRIKVVSLEKQTFTPKENAGDEVFANSLGVNTGPAAQVEIEFEPRVAPYVRARVWHTSQQVRERADGALILSMNVCHDWALRSWILSWGRFAHVLAPAGLAKELRADLQAATERYGAGGRLSRTLPD
jgi:predicted DNA-binding transcriptional regulator YafY